MSSCRPLLYLSLPGVAFILGMLWFKRRNKNRYKNNKILDELENKTEENAPSNCSDVLESKSININANVSFDMDKSTTILLAKSTPILIMPNGRISPAKQQKVDSYILKAKIGVENKILSSINENFDNQFTLCKSESLNNCSRIQVAIKREPVLIKASPVPQILPQNLLLRNISHTECEQINLKNESKLNDSEIKNLNTQYGSEIMKNMQTECGSNTIDNSNEKRIEDSVSPCLSLCSSVRSGDSGKGSSLPRSEATGAKTTYQFLFPTSLIGYLYGRKRSFISQIIAQTSATILLRKNQYSDKVKICILEGTETAVNAAYEMIRQRLPAKRYPNFTMQRIHYALPQTIVPLSSNMLNIQLSLIEGINNDVVVSSVISGGHIFVQHPLHPSHPSLAVLQKCLYLSYTASETPLLPGIEIGAVCVLAVNDIWYRVQIVERDITDDQRCLVIFVDFGGYMNVDLNELRQIRSDFMGTPFQATECILSNIEPIDICWSTEAADILIKLTKGIVLQAQIAGYNTRNIPEIYLFACLGPKNVVFINKELVARNLARWVDSP